MSAYNTAEKQPAPDHSQPTIAGDQPRNIDKPPSRLQQQCAPRQLSTTASRTNTHSPGGVAGVF